MATRKIAKPAKTGEPDHPGTPPAAKAAAGYLLTDTEVSARLQTVRNWR